MIKEIMDALHMTGKNSWSVGEVNDITMGYELNALRDIMTSRMLKYTDCMKSVFNRDDRPDFTEEFRKKQAKYLKSKKMDSLNEILSKYVDLSDSQIPENLFTHYMKHIVCGDREAAFKLIDYVYRNSSHLDIDKMNELVYNAIIELLKAKTLVEIADDDSYSNRFDSESYRQRWNTLRFNGDYAVVNPIIKDNGDTEPGEFQTHIISKSYDFSPSHVYSIQGLRHNDDFFDNGSWVSDDKDMHYVVTDGGHHLHINLKYRKLNIEAFRGISSCTPMRIDARTSGPACRNLVFYSEFRESDNEWIPAIKMVSMYNMHTIERTAPGRSNLTIGVLSNADVRDYEGIEDDEAKVLETAMTITIRQVLKDIIRKDHALEDLIAFMVQLVMVTPAQENRRIYEEANNDDSLVSLFSNDCFSKKMLHNTIRAVMAAILCPINRWKGNFAENAPLEYVARFADMNKYDVKECLFHFGAAFAWMFHAGKEQRSDGFLNIENFRNWYRSFPFPTNAINVTETEAKARVRSVLMPRMICLFARLALDPEYSKPDDDGNQVLLSEGSTILRNNMGRITPTESFILSDIPDKFLGACMQFYTDILSTVLFMIGHKAALYGTTVFNNLYSCHMVYGMSNNLIHAVYKKIRGKRDVTIAVPFTQALHVGTMYDNLRNNYCSTYDPDIIIRHIGLICKNLNLIKAKISQMYVKDGLRCWRDTLKDFPDLTSKSILYMQDTDSIDLFAPGFTGMFRPEDRGYLEEMFSKARYEIENYYYVISGRRPLVKEEYESGPFNNETIEQRTYGDYGEIDAAMFQDIKGALPDFAIDNSEISLDARRTIQAASSLKPIYLDIDYPRYDNSKRVPQIMEAELGEEDAEGETEKRNLLRNLFESVAKPDYIKIRYYNRMMLLYYFNDEVYIDTENNTRFPYYNRFNQKYLYNENYDTMTELLVPGNAVPRPFDVCKDVMCIGTARADRRIFKNTTSQLYMAHGSSDAPSYLYSYEERTGPRLLVHTLLNMPERMNYRNMIKACRRWQFSKYPNYIINAIATFGGPGTGKGLFSYCDRNSILIARHDASLTSSKLDADAIVRATNDDINRINICISECMDNIDALRNGHNVEENWLKKVIEQLNDNDHENLSEDEYIVRARKKMYSLFNRGRMELLTFADSEDINRSFNLYMEIYDKNKPHGKLAKSRSTVIAFMLAFMHNPNTYDLKDLQRLLTVTTDTAEPFIEGELTKLASKVRSTIARDEIKTLLGELRRQRRNYERAYKDAMDTILKDNAQIRATRKIANGGLLPEESGMKAMFEDGSILGARVIISDRVNKNNKIVDLTEENIQSVQNLIKDSGYHAHMCVRIPPVYIWCGAFIYDIGEICIVLKDILNFSSLSPLFYAKKRLAERWDDSEILRSFREDAWRNAGGTSSGIDAVHVRGGGACLGSLQNLLNDAATENDIESYLHYCIQYLYTVNLDDDLYGKSINLFPCVPATLHNVIKYGVLHRSRLSEKLCLWTGSHKMKAYNDMSVVVPVWMIKRDLLEYLWKDAKAKLDENRFEGSDMNADAVENILSKLETEDDMVKTWLENDKVGMILASICHYAIYKRSPSSNPSFSVLGNQAIYSHEYLLEMIRHECQVKPENIGRFQKQARALMDRVMNENIDFKSIWPGYPETVPEKRMLGMEIFNEGE